MCGGQLEHLATQLWFLEGSIYGCHDEAGHQGDADKSGNSLLDPTGAAGN